MNANDTFWRQLRLSQTTNFFFQCTATAGGVAGLLEAAATVGCCGDCWKLRRVSGKSRNMTENSLSILIVLSSVQTETTDRKLFIFQHGLPCI